MAELKAVRKSFHGTVIFEDVNLKLEEGKATCFVGHNGCGKSTMLKLVGGIISNRLPERKKFLGNTGET